MKGHIRAFMKGIAGWPCCDLARNPFRVTLAYLDSEPFHLDAGVLVVYVMGRWKAAATPTASTALLSRPSGIAQWLLLVALTQ